MKHFIVDTEDARPTLTGWTLREFGAVEFDSEESFHGKDSSKNTFLNFREWLYTFGKTERLIFVSDNVAYDWPPIHFYFNFYFQECNFESRNPFGYSARRIGDFYAGLVGDFGKQSEWKSLRVTRHDHNPVNDAMGNVEALKRMLKGERGKRR